MRVLKGWGIALLIVVVAAVIWTANLTGDKSTAGDTVPVAATSPPTAPSPTPTPPVPSPPTPSQPPTETPSPRHTPIPTEPPSPTPTADPDLVPVVGIVDGDTIRVRVDGVTERVRIIGIDTPEMTGECYAQEATSKMQSLAQSRSVRLVADPTQDDRDRYDRLLRHVVLEDGRSAAEVLIAGGYGREYTYRDAYQGQSAHVAAERAARDGGLGLWGACSSQAASAAGTSARDQGTAPQTDSTPAGACDIKGNINREGVKIYHVPGSRSYDKTKINEANGERWFCSEAEARDAGWRAPRG
ncbi:MAG: thermonuclease family protein [Mobilicoccus sp.]|nr:thermonuclease family protein [Mobilicoccus sp.]